MPLEHHLFCVNFKHGGCTLEGEVTSTVFRRIKIILFEGKGIVFSYSVPECSSHVLGRGGAETKDPDPGRRRTAAALRSRKGNLAEGLHSNIL